MIAVCPVVSGIEPITLLFPSSAPNENSHALPLLFRFWKILCWAEDSLLFACLLGRCNLGLLFIFRVQISSNKKQSGKCFAANKARIVLATAKSMAFWSWSCNWSGVSRIPLLIGCIVAARLSRLLKFAKSIDRLDNSLD